MQSDESGVERAVPADDAGPASETPASDHLREIVREAVAEAFADQRELIRSIVEEALQDIAWSDARREFEGPDRRAGRPAGFRAVDGEA
jgi:hypothetical protein